MTTYFVAPDGHDEPTLWARTDDPEFPQPIFRRRDLNHSQSHHWDEIVRRVTDGNLTAQQRWALDKASGKTLQQILDNQDAIADQFEAYDFPDKDRRQDIYPDCGHERRPGTWGHNGECLTCHGITGGFGKLNMDGTVTPVPFTVTPSE